MREIFRELKESFRANAWNIFIAFMVAVIILVAVFAVSKFTDSDNKKIYECTVTFQNGEIKTFVCDKIFYNGDFATITVDDVIYKIPYENLEVKIYENSKN